MKSIASLGFDPIRDILCRGKSIAALVIAVELRPGVEFRAELVAAPDKKLWFASAYTYLPDLDACDIAQAVCDGATAGRCGKYNWRVSSLKWA